MTATWDSLRLKGGKVTVAFVSSLFLRKLNIALISLPAAPPKYGPVSYLLLASSAASSF